MVKGACILLPLRAEFGIMPKILVLLVCRKQEVRGQGGFQTDFKGRSRK